MNTKWNQSQSSSKSSQKPSQVKPYNFLEALKDIGSGVKTQAKDATLGGLEEAINQVNRLPSDQKAEEPPKPQAPINYAEYLRVKESRIQQEGALAKRQQKTETLIFHQKQASAQKEIEAIKAALKEMVAEVGEMSTELYEAEKTVITTTVAGGTYHLNFFNRIRNLIKLAKKRISESKTWLQMFNARNQNKSFYWTQAKQGTNTRFTLSPERGPATRVG